MEETELTPDIPEVGPLKSTYYAFPSCNSSYPESSAEETPRMHLAGVSFQDGRLLWSAAIDVSGEHDVFVRIPEVSDVKVHVERVCYTMHVFIDPVSRAEISAKEVRSRIKGKEKRCRGRTEETDRSSQVNY